MTLDNLVGRGLEKIEADPIMIRKLLHAAYSNLRDSAIENLSNENRFDIAYKAVMQLANASLQANGFRTLSSVPGHHQTMIQTLPKTIGLSREKTIELDALRKQRNITDYSGDLVSSMQLDACIELATELYQLVKTWMIDKNVIKLSELPENNY